MALWGIQNGGGGVDISGGSGGIGVYIGETWTVLGFADFEKYEESNGKIIEPGEKAKIDFYSFRATKQVSAILSSDPTLFEYALKARSKKDWDVKAHAPEGNVYYGSLLYGKYASARDAGNFAAGAVAQKSFVPNIIIDYGYGTYNLSGNSVRKSLLMITVDGVTYLYNPILGMGIMYYRAKYGENVLSRSGIEAGKMYIKNKGL